MTEVDLGALRVTLNGGEPVDCDGLTRFAEAMAPFDGGNAVVIGNGGNGGAGGFGIPVGSGGAGGSRGVLFGTPGANGADG